MTSAASYRNGPPGVPGESWFRPMGLPLRLVTDSPAVRAAAEAAFGGFGPGEPGPAAAFTLRLFAHDVEGGGEGPPVLRADGPLVYQTTGRGSTLVLDRAAGHGFGYFAPATLADRDSFRWHFLDLALFFLLEGRGFLGLHGAALARAGRALLLRAPSGGGKSTLAYAASRRRFRALAEDLVWLAPEAAAVWGMPWKFHLLPDAPRLFPELAGAAPEARLNGERKIAVDLERLRPGSTTASAAPAGVVFLRRTPGSPSRIEPAAPAGAWDEWLAGAASREREVPGYDGRIRELLHALPVHRLAVGDDVEEALDLLEPLLPREEEP